MANRSIFDFPNPVNEFSARLVAGGVVAMTSLYLLTSWLPILMVLAYGFVARVATGPTLSPLGQLTTRILTPRLEAAVGRAGPLVSGPPKRFAQAIGATLSVGALVAELAGVALVPPVLVGAILVAASLESLAGYCLGCVVFGWLIGAGLVPRGVCADCADLAPRLQAAVVKTGR